MRLRPPMTRKTLALLGLCLLICPEAGAQVVPIFMQVLRASEG